MIVDLHELSSAVQVRLWMMRMMERIAVMMKLQLLNLLAAAAADDDDDDGKDNIAD